MTEINPNEEDYGEDDPVEDEWETYIQDCGQDRNGSCGLAGSEYCEFECPFNR